MSRKNRPSRSGRLPVGPICFALVRRHVSHNSVDDLLDPRLIGVGPCVVEKAEGACLWVAIGVVEELPVDRASRQSLASDDAWWVVLCLLVGPERARVRRSRSLPPASQIERHRPHQKSSKGAATAVASASVPSGAPGFHHSAHQRTAGPRRRGSEGEEMPPRPAQPRCCVSWQLLASDDVPSPLGDDPHSREHVTTGRLVHNFSVAPRRPSEAVTFPGQAAGTRTHARIAPTRALGDRGCDVRKLALHI
jgi:hypothetical protein